MQNQATTTLSVSGGTPWNKGRLIGTKPPLRPKHVWTIRIKLQVEHRTRDLAMFNLAIDSKLRGCDVVALRVEDVAPYGVALDRATLAISARSSFYWGTARSRAPRDISGLKLTTRWRLRSKWTSSAPEIVWGRVTVLCPFDNRAAALTRNCAARPSFERVRSSPHCRRDTRIPGVSL